MGQRFEKWLAMLKQEKEVAKQIKKINTLPLEKDLWWSQPETKPSENAKYHKKKWKQKHTRNKTWRVILLNFHTYYKSTAIKEK